MLVVGARIEEENGRELVRNRQVAGPYLRPGWIKVARREEMRFVKYSP